MIGARLEQGLHEGPLVTAERDQVPTLETIDRMRLALTLIAEEFGRDYDGWEAATER